MLFDKEPILFISTTKPQEAKAFYKSKLGLMFLAEDKNSMLFRANGILLRILIVKELTPLPVPVLGWRVVDISESIKVLKGKNISCEMFKSRDQEKTGIWTAPHNLKMAWFKDPDENILSISELE